MDKIRAWICALMSESVDGCVRVWRFMEVFVQTDRQTDRQKDRKTDDRQTDGQTDRFNTITSHNCTNI